MNVSSGERFTVDKLPVEIFATCDSPITARLTKSAGATSLPRKTMYSRGCLAYAVLFVAAGRTLQASAGVFSEGCQTNATVPMLYRRSFYVSNKGAGYPVAANVSIFTNALILDGSNMLTTHPHVGVISRECIQSFIVDSNNHFLFAVVVGITENVSFCTRFLLKPAGSAGFEMFYSFMVQERNVPVCDTVHHPPSTRIGITGPVSAARKFPCSSVPVIPNDLVGAPVLHRCDLRVAHGTVPCYEGFTSGGWFVVSARRTP